MNSESKTNTDPSKASPSSILPAVNDPLQVKNVALVVIMVIAIIFALDWAQSFIITMLLGILLSHTLNPIVIWLESMKVPRWIGSTVVILALIGGIIFSAYALRGQVQSIITKLPEAATKLTSTLETKRGAPLTNLQKVQIAATQVETATSAVENTNVIGNNTPRKKSTMHVVIDERKFRVADFLWRGSLGVFGFVGEAITMIFLAYFLLLSGDIFRRKMVRLTGPSLTRKKITVNILDDISHSTQRYMFMLLVTNVMVGLLTWIALRVIGLENAGAWSVAAGFMHLVPYFGPVITAGVTGMAAYMQFDSLLIAFTVAGISMLIATIIGVFVTTWMTGRIAKMNPAAVFISLLFFAWLWGLWGMLLGIPIIVIIKVICEHIEQFQPIAELLGD
ncbi:MAG TPA: AI-2E family transporter [Methylotenera sp.]|nr:AI-2E family transporter [Methylotenera sp.]